MTGGWFAPLAALRWHWDEACIINCHGCGRWTAERRDTRETLRDQTPRAEGCGAGARAALVTLAGRAG